MSRQNFRIHVPRRTQQGFDSARFGRKKANRLRVYRIILLADVDDRLELAAEGLGIAVSCEAHELRGVVGQEAKIAADDLPYEAYGVRIVERIDLLNARTDGLCQARAGRLADTIDGEDGRAIET